MERKSRDALERRESGEYGRDRQRRNPDQRWVLDQAQLPSVDRGQMESY